MNALKIIETGDGSHSLLHTGLNETYHSIHGAVQESLHVFIDKGLSFFLETFQRQSVRIFEVGFGTGLNAFLTAKYAAARGVTVSYVSIEAFPLDEQQWQALNYASMPDEQRLFTSLHDSPWEEEAKISDTFTLRKVRGRVQDISFAPDAFDIIYFDAFAPNKQPEMWDFSVLSKMHDILADGGAFVTYCAKGQLKRDLKSAGFQVETLQGPPGKKEMVRGVKPA